MGISSKTRKILWGNAANRCAICRCSLVIDKTEADAESVVGEECHIISESNEGPRNEFAEQEMRFDEYDNLILLCAVHHKMVDDQRIAYSPDVLRLIKKNHEDWVNRSLAKEKSVPFRIRRIKKNIPEYLFRITSENGLLVMLDGCHASYQNFGEGLTDEQIQIGGDFFQTAQEHIDLSGQLEPVEKARSLISIRHELRELEKHGLYVFAATENFVTEGGSGDPMAWKAAHISIMRQDDPLVRILKSAEEEK